MTQPKRGNVWLGVAGIVENKNGEWLVVKKRYGGLKGKWSFPAGFVDQGETIDEAVVREVREETGILAKVEGVVGIRSGVIKEIISDNLIIFTLKAMTNEINVQQDELYDAAFVSPGDLVHDPNSSLLLVKFSADVLETRLKRYDQYNPGNHFGYRAYTLYL